MGKTRACSRCEALSTSGQDALFAEGPPRHFRRFRLHPSFSALALSASRGCQICQVFAMALFESAKANGAVVDLFTSSAPVSILGHSTVNVAVRELSEFT